MEEIAGKAADQYLQQGILGATVIVLIIALVLLWRENKAERKAHDEASKAKDKIIFDLQEAWRNDTRTSLGSVTAALETVQHTIDALTERPRH